MDNVYTFTTPNGNRLITIDAKHANLVKPYQWTVSFQNQRSSWRVFGTDKNGKRVHLRTLLWPNLFINGNRFALTFKNGNFIDYRESNVIAETWGQMLNRSYGQKARKARKRESRDSIHTIVLHGCKLRPAPNGRCQDYLDCDNYEDCLYWVAENTKWDGWRAEVV